MDGSLRSDKRALDRLALPAAATLRGFLIITVALDVFRQTLFFTHLLETLEHLVDGFVASCLNLNHAKTTCSFLVLNLLRLAKNETGP